MPGTALLIEVVATPSELRSNAMEIVGVAGAVSVAPVSAALPQTLNRHTPSSTSSHVFNLTCISVRIIARLVWVAESDAAVFGSAVEDFSVVRRFVSSEVFRQVRKVHVLESG